MTPNLSPFFAVKLPSVLLALASRKQSDEQNNRQRSRTDISKASSHSNYFSACCQAADSSSTTKIPILRRSATPTRPQQVARAKLPGRLQRL